MSTATDILAAAAQLVDVDRMAQWGDPVDSHERIAAMWTATLGQPISARQVALCMAQLKISRALQNPTDPDSYADAAAYIAIAAQCAGVEL